jgi:nucleoid DNA-binding protein
VPQVRRKRIGRDPLHPTRLYTIPMRRVVRFRVAKELDARLNGKTR